MFCGKSANNSITTAHRRALRAVEMNFSKSYEELLNISSSLPIHMKNLRLLMIEVYKSINRLNPEFMWNMFENKDVSFSLRRGKLLTLPEKKIAGTNDLVFRACLAWNNLPSTLKLAPTLKEFKSGINQVDSIYCKCKLCLT